MTKATKRKPGRARVEAPRSDVHLLDPDDIIIVGLDTEDGPEHPLCEPTRNALPVPEHRVRNVVRYGIKTPIIVRRDGDRTLAVTGRQRIKWGRAAKELLRDEGSAVSIRVPCVFHRGEIREAAAIAVLENDCRENPTPTERAKKIQRLLDLGHSTEEAAVATGSSVATVRDLLRILEASPEIQRAVDAGELRQKEAAKLAAKPVTEQKAAAEKAKAGAVEKRERKERGEPAAPKFPRAAVNAAILKVATRLQAIEMPDVIRDRLVAICSWTAGECADEVFLEAFGGREALLQLQELEPDVEEARAELAATRGDS